MILVTKIFESFWTAAGFLGVIASIITICVSIYEFYKWRSKLPNEEGKNIIKSICSFLKKFPKWKVIGLLIIVAIAIFSIYLINRIPKYRIKIIVPFEHIDGKRLYINGNQAAISETGYTPDMTRGTLVYFIVDSIPKGNHTFSINNGECWEYVYIHENEQEININCH